MSDAPPPFEHSPVMEREIVDLFAPVPPGTIVDATIGGGGHAQALLDSRSDIEVLGLDRDPAAIDASQQRLARFGERFRIVRARFDELGEVVDASGVDDVSGALFDLGVSSPQLDSAARGFSFRHDGPLDMRMDTDQPWSADDVVNGYDESELARIIAGHGDERFARRIARAICAERPIQSTSQLAAVVTEAIPAATRRSGGHPAKRTFQAIRIEVNAELEAIGPAIETAVDTTRTGGRVAVLSYHSGEDRIVKQSFAAAAGACDCPPGLPCVCDAVQTVRLVRDVPKRPSDAERESNPRASSARLRVVEKIAAVYKRDGSAVNGRGGTA